MQHDSIKILLTSLERETGKRLTHWAGVFSGPAPHAIKNSFSHAFLSLLLFFAFLHAFHKHGVDTILNMVFNLTQPTRLRWILSEKHEP